MKEVIIVSKTCGHCHHEQEAPEERRHSHDHSHEHGNEPGHSHDHSHGEEADRKTMLIRIIASAALLGAGLIIPSPAWLKIALYLLSWLAVGSSVAVEAVKSLLRGEALDEMFLMTVASVGAFCLGDFPEGVAVMLLYQIGEFFQDYAVDRSRDSIAELMDIRPDSAQVERDGRLMTLVPEMVRLGEVMVIRPGEKVPLDGLVLEGESSLNTVALTGESAPRAVKPGDMVLSGCVNGQGLLRVEVTHLYADSTVSRILELVEHASEHKSRADRFITRFARVYTPIVVGAAVLLALLPPVLFHGNWREWITTALTFLVISCPCALVISVPLTYFSGIGGASRRGILIKGANYLETLARAEMAVFDKTGTLTRGAFTVTEIHAADGNDQELLSLAAAAETFSTHPIAQSLRDACGAGRPKNAENVEEIAGHGVTAQVEGHRVSVGSEKLMVREGVSFPRADSLGTVAHVAVDGKYAGYIVIADEIKPGAGEAVAELKALGVKKAVMLTGDRQAAARQVGQALSLDEIHAELLPDGKVEMLEALLSQKTDGGALIFVGDGINDAPVLARADVGVAMGALGSDAAIEAADVVLMDDDPRKLPLAVRIARATRRIVRQNIAFSLAVKALVMILGVFHASPLWAAVFADVGVCFLAILNAMRAMRAAEKQG